MDAYRGPFPTPASRRPTAVFPREILASRPFLADVERRLPLLRDRPALLVWPTGTSPSARPSAGAGRRSSPTTAPSCCEGAGHYIQEDAPTEIVAAIRAWAPGP